MIIRQFWIDRLTDAWRHAPIVWLSGVRRSGKTTLAKSLGVNRIRYINCDLPASADMLNDPVLFFQDTRGKIVVFDEIHQLSDPTRVLKIGADEFPDLRILATGSSTLAAGHKFRDTLTGRKRTVHLPPVLWNELETFGHIPLLKRLSHGGLPASLLTDKKDPAVYREWLDSFFARDIQRLYAFRNVDKFNAFFEYILKQSGGLFDVASASSALGISRPTLESHLRALEATHAVKILRPFHGGHRKELVKTPKVYGFDTGFVGFARGWDPLRPEDLGVLWEHLCLEFLGAHFPNTPLHHWRDQQGHEMDFVLVRNRDEVDAIECKWDVSHFTPAALKVFRSYHPKGRNCLIVPNVPEAYRKSYGALTVQVGSLRDIPAA